MRARTGGGGASAAHCWTKLNGASPGAQSGAGIAFGLYADYGAAQRLYIKRGYVPDGRGLHYGVTPARPGQCYRLDDELVLYLLKRL